VHNGFSSGDLGPGEENKEFGACPVLGFTAGRIHPSKGLHVLLDGMARARVLGCNLRLIVRGAFAEETPGYEKEIKGKIAALNLSGLISFGRLMQASSFRATFHSRLRRRAEGAWVLFGH
jgi:hypothetical protein